MNSAQHEMACSESTIGLTLQGVARRRRIAVALAALLVCIGFAVRSTAHNTPANGTIVGVVSSSMSGPLTGARVEALRDGTVTAASVLTSSNGSFSLSVPAGIYDVRATDNSAGLVAGVTVDIGVTSGGTIESNITLDPRWVVAAQNGADYTLLADSDSDLVTNLAELAQGLNPNHPDTNSDGVSDGQAVWCGADPLNGPESTTSAPNLVWPSPQSLIHVSNSGASARMGLLFDRVEGATGYRITLCDQQQVPVLDSTFEFGSGEDLVVGHSRACCSFPLPGALTGGTYTLSIQGFYGDQSFSVGNAFSAGLNLVPQTTPPLVIGSSTALSGWIIASTIRITQGTVVTIPAGETLVLSATGSQGVLVEAGASVVGGPGASLVILSEGKVNVRGVVSGGDGLDAPDSEVIAGGGVDAFASASGGGNAGSVYIFSGGDCQVSRTGSVRAGDGGSGGSAAAFGGSTAVFGEDGGDAHAIAGDGGRGGDLVVLAQSLRIAFRSDIVHIGNGGEGGDVYAVGGDAGTNAVGGAGWTESAVGGNSGDVFLSDWDSRGDGCVLYPMSTWCVVGGLPGSSGTGVLQNGENGEVVDVVLACECGPSEDGESKTRAKEKKGADGTWYGGEGGWASARGKDGKGCGRGGNATCEGGDGGNAKGVGISFRVGGIPIGIGGSGNAGNGGLAIAVGGNGGERGVGAGGDATATGGKGGESFATALGVLSTGGMGGVPNAKGGDGQNGYSCCSPPVEAGDGGDGGDATAVGGQGGAGMAGGSGGSATCTSGTGGSGGNGCPPGDKGTHGDCQAVSGTGGHGVYLNGVDGTDIENDGNDGVDGSDCCVEG